MKSKPPDDTLIQKVISAIDEAFQVGCPVAPYDPKQQEETAKIAIRRWLSSSRRGIPSNDMERRVRDLAKGFAEEWYKDLSLVGPLMIDIEYLASKISEVIQQEA